MAYSSDTSQIVKTYGKPRLTQKLGQVSFWHDDLADDFDKCLGIEDVRQTTFISPERVDSVTPFKSEKFKNKFENKTKTNDGWSMRLQSTLSGSKDNLIYKKRSIECSSNRNYGKKPLLKIAKQEKNNNFKTKYSNDSSKLNMDNSNSSIKSKAVTSTSIKKLKNKFNVSKKQCSTPLQKSLLFGYRNKVNNISSNKKKKKSKIKTNLAHTLDDSCPLEVSTIPNNLHFNISDSLAEINNKFNPFEESVQISSSHGLKLSNNVPSSITNKYTQGLILNDHTTYHKPISIKPKKISNVKKINNPSCSKENNSNWYSKVINIFCDEKFNSFEERFNKEHIIEEIVTVEDSLENSTESNNSLYVSCYQIDENKVIENTRSPNIIDVINVTDDYKSVDNPKSIECELSQLNQFDKSILANNLSQMIQNKSELLSLNSSYNLGLNNSSEFCADSLDNKLFDVLTKNTKPDTNENFNSTSLASIEDVSHHQNDGQFTPDSECQIITITNSFSDFTIGDETELNDQFIIEEIELNELGQSLHLAIDKSELEDDINSNKSSVSQSSSSSGENCTVICVQNCADVNLKENNSNSYKELLNDENIVSLGSCSQYSSEEESLKCNNNNKLSKDVLFNSNQSFSVLNDQTNISNILETNKSRRKRYASRFQNTFNLDSIDESTNGIYNSTQRYQDHSESIWVQQNTSGFHLEPGKKWRRSLIIVRNFIDRNLDQTTNFTQNITKGRKWTSTVDDVLRQQPLNTSMHQSVMLRNSMDRTSQRYLEKNLMDNEVARKYILEACNEQKIISFESWLESKSKKNWKKVGEGVYGEVFMYKAERNYRVIKIIPIEGKICINSERQKCMNEVYSEILIAKELNNLRNKNNWNRTSAFCKVENISCVLGKYPEKLIKLWTQYDTDDVKGSDNDNPNILPDNQMFIILEMENGGKDVESFEFNSASQALFAFLQIVFGLAIAEHQFDFEHRDLHIGNILVNKVVASKKISCKLDGEIFTIPSQGVKITIIDFTLSRMTYINKPIYNDLSEDTELFSADGDYQFEIYRLMKKETDDQWDSYRPKTNIFWLHYVLDKMLESVHYKNTETIVHNTGLKNLRKLKNSILSFDSAKSFAESDIVRSWIK